MLVISVLLVIGVVLSGGCTPKPEPPAQIILKLTPQQASDLIQNNAYNPDFFIIDVRTLGEFATGHLENAILIDFKPGGHFDDLGWTDTFTERIGYLDRNRTYLVYCRAGGLSGQALAIMESLGFTEVYNILGGILAWQEAGLPVVTE